MESLNVRRESNVKPVSFAPEQTFGETLTLTFAPSASGLSSCRKISCVMMAGNGHPAGR